MFSRAARPNDLESLASFEPAPRQTKAKKIRSAALRYGIALAASGATVAVAAVLQLYSVKLNLTLLVVVAVLLPVWFGGKGPGLLTLFVLEAVTIFSKPFPPPETRLSEFIFSQLSVLAVFVFLIFLVSTIGRSARLLRQRSKLLQVTLASIADAVIATDISGTITFINNTAEALTGWTMAEAIYRPLSDVFRIVDESARARIAGPNARVLAEGAVVTFSDSVLLVTRNSEEVPIEVSGSPIMSDAGTPVGVTFVFRDITERRQATAAIRQLNETLEQRVHERTVKLEAANKELEAFSYSVSHDLRAPLRAIDGFSRIFVEDYGQTLDAEGRRILEVIRTNAQNMGHLIDDLLEFSRLGRKPIETSIINMQQLASDVTNEISAHPGAKSVNFNIDPIPTVNGDCSLIRQVFVNLCSNAVKYSTPREQIEVSIGAQNSGHENIYYVRDNGVGFDMTYSNKLFGVFQRLHGADEFEGTGVGLAIVHRIIDRHGGRVWAEAEVEKGATFYFALPRNRAGLSEATNG